jgi:hypothetical protein
MWVKDGLAAKRKFYAKDCWCGGGGGGGGGGSLDSLEAVGFRTPSERKYILKTSFE